MIIERIRWRNFLSTGNHFIEFDLTKSNTTLFSGNNGSGKSTFLDALTFSLFGKSFRRNNIPQLVNSINNKNCVTEIEFSVGSNNFKVVRGLKPKLFEIYKNDELIPQDSKSKDYQKILEEQILKMTYKSFCQVVILGSSNYIPFMQLTASDRRSVVETLLYIDVFSSMNGLLKIKLSTIREDLQTVDHKIELLKEKTKNQQKIISTIEDRSSESIKEYKKEIEYSNKQVSDFKEEVKESEDNIDSLLLTVSDEQKQIDKLKELEDQTQDTKRNIKLHEKNISFYEKNNTCPSCSQNIKESYKNDILKDNQNNIKTLSENLSDLDVLIEKTEGRLQEIDNIIKKIKKFEDIISESKNNISATIKYISSLDDKMTSIINEKNEIVEETLKLNELIEEAQEQIEKRKDLIDDMHYYNIGSSLLKDTGIKSKIIKHYLPIMNKLINKYLSIMNFFCQFTLDESFNETIKSRFRDEFTYQSFSEGERLRIDLSLLLAWREIARLKNSVNCNLLVLDEVFDSSLDAVGTEEFLNILKGMGKKANIFVISHKSDTMSDKFDRHIVFEKKNNFTKIKS
jgi:DNA repair exonuclease SbcCD ATPase subunit